MIIFPFLLARAAEEAGMKVPEDTENFDAATFPHFWVFCQVQLGVPMEPNDHWENAKVIAAISEEEIKRITVGQLIERGFHCKTVM